MQENNVCTTTVMNSLCVGCGVCAGICPHGNLVMVENSERGYNPLSLGNCNANCSQCLLVCPFRDHEVNEDSLGSSIHGITPGIRHTAQTGYFIRAYAGYAAEKNHRWQGASGGMATWFLKQLMLSGIVDHVICVTSCSDPDRLFQFSILSHPEDIIRSAKSAYYPVELSGVLRKMTETPGRYAIIGLPCFVKGVRLAAIRNPKVRERIKVYAGLTCGQLKSKAFAESLARYMGLDPRSISRFCFRHKAPDRPPTNFSVTVHTDITIGSMECIGFYCFAWMSGMFKFKACDFCDDIYSELADISFMDAWLPDYSTENAGTSLIITRSLFAEQLITEAGIDQGGCILKEIPIDDVIRSQLGVIEQKRRLLAFRLWVAAAKGWHPPKKRVPPLRPSLLEYLRVLNFDAVRRKSFCALASQRQDGSPGLAVFMREMRHVLYLRKWLFRLDRNNMRSGMKRRYAQMRARVRLWR